MDISINADDVSAIASKAIFETLSQQARDDILQKAVSSLLTPSRSGYGATSQTPLQIAFENAIATAAHKVVRERLLEDPEVAAGIDRLLGPLLASAMSAEAAHHDTSLADAVGAALGTWLAERARSDR